jgi:hypothetical protein
MVKGKKETYNLIGGILVDQKIQNGIKCFRKPVSACIQKASKMSAGDLFLNSG